MAKGSQVDVTPFISKVSTQIDGEGLDYVNNTVKFVNTQIKIRPYNEDTAEDEKSIRWKRTADEILKDNYVYEKKACTDMVIVFIVLCLAKGYECNFVKVKEKEGKRIHSVAEVRFGNEWYVVDVAGRNGVIKGQLSEGSEFGEWVYWKKGRDSWDIGMSSYDNKNET